MPAGFRFFFKKLVLFPSEKVKAVFEQKIISTSQLRTYNIMAALLVFPPVGRLEFGSMKSFFPQIGEGVETFGPFFSEGEGEGRKGDFPMAIASPSTMSLG